MKNDSASIACLIVKTLKKSLIKSDPTVGLHEPVFKGNEWIYVKECLDTGWVSSVGKYVERFERMLQEFTGVQHAVAVTNGTSALHLALILSDIKPGDEVLVPALTFIATANAVSYCGAIPHFVDSEEKTLGLDPVKLEQYLNEIAIIKSGTCYNKLSGHPIKVVLPMHTFGHPVDMDPLVEIAKKFKLAIIEDAAESLGSLYKGRHTGNFGCMAILSFNGNKVITTGGGGAIITNDKKLAKLAKHLSTQAKLPHRWSFEHDAVGYNYRMPNINAALGCAQLERLPKFIEAKRSLAKRYQEAFDGLPGVTVFKEAEFARSNYWLNVLLLDCGDERDDVLRLTNDAGIMTRPVWTLMTKLPMYKNCPRMELSCAESLEKRIINIPSSVYLGENYE